MTYDETEQRVAAFVAQQIRNGVCVQCLAKAMIGVVVDSAFDHGIVADVHALLYRTAHALDDCRSDQPDQTAH